jgi:sodium/hydrogen antiporter
MEEFNLILALLGGLVLLLGLGSQWLAESPAPPTLAALLLGVLLGPQALNLIDLARLGDTPIILERAARVTLGIGLMGVALRIPRTYPRRQWRTLVVLIGLGMPLMWGVSTLLVALILGLPLGLAALVGAIITPTDPVAASPIVTGDLAEQNIPDRLRHAISFDSGANDGLSYLFVLLPFLFLTRPVGEALGHWLLRTLLWEVAAATLFGLLIGYAAGKLLQLAEGRGAIQSDWRLVYTVALALFAVGAGKLIQSDELLVCFAAGAAFAQVVSAEDRENEEHGQEAVNRFFSVPIFALLGLALPWEGWRALGWGGVLLAIAVLLLRRPPALLLLRPLLSGFRTRPDALFVGWFGPIAVAAIYYAALMEHRLGEPRVWHIVSLVICASVLAHGASGAPLTRWYGRIAGLRSGLPPDPPEARS